MDVTILQKLLRFNRNTITNLHQQQEFFKEASSYYFSVGLAGLHKNSQNNLLRIKKQLRDYVMCQRAIKVLIRDTFAWERMSYEDKFGVY